MSIVKRLSGLVMAVIAAITFCSCDKEGTETSSASGIVGTWRITHFEYSFNDKITGTETATEIEAYHFGEDGHLTYLTDDFTLPIPYSYSPKNKTLTMTMFGAYAIFLVKKLTSTELVFTTYGFNGEDSESIDYGKNLKYVDSYKGFKIYEYDDDCFCYRNKGEMVPCAKLYIEDIDGNFSGDIEGYYDRITAYLKRVK